MKLLFSLLLSCKQLLNVQIDFVLLNILFVFWFFLINVFKVFVFHVNITYSCIMKTFNYVILHYLKKILKFFLFLLIIGSKETLIAHFNNVIAITIIVFVNNFV
jgi:hypothetical protein